MLGQIQSLARNGYGRSDAQQALIATHAAKRSGMKHQVFRTELERPQHLAAKRLNRLGQELVGLAGHIDEVVGVNHERAEIVFFAQTTQFVALGPAQLVGLPLSWASGEYLEGIATQAVGTLGGVLDSSGDRGVNADAARGVKRRPLRSGHPEDVLLLGN